MKKIFLSCVILLISAYLLCGQQQEECVVQPLCNTMDLIVEDLGDDRTLLVINTEDAEGAYWFLIEQFHSTFLGKDVGVMHYVEHMLVSPDKKYLAVISVGEGHPVLNIINLQEFLERKIFRSSYEFDAYPGLTIDIEKWEGKNLYIISDTLLTHRTEKYNRVHPCLVLNDTETFAFSLMDGSIQPISEGANNPLEYFSKGLSSTNPHQRIDAACALEILSDTNAIPILQEALEKEENKDARDRIGKTLDSLNKQ